MVNSSNNMISKTHDQLLNFVNKIQQNCYYQQQQLQKHFCQHYHHYFNDLFYRCSVGRKRRKIKPQNKPNKYLNSCSCSSNSVSISSNYNITAIATNTGVVANVWSSVVNWKNYQFYYYLRYIWFYFQKNFNSLQLVIVIFLLALITTTAQQSINTSENTHQKSTSTSPQSSLLNTTNLVLILVPLRDINNINESIINNRRPSYQPTFLNNGKNVSSKYKMNVCHNLTHLSQADKSLKILQDDHSEKFQIVMNSEQNSIQNHYRQYDDDDHVQQHQNDSSVIKNNSYKQTQEQHFYFNTKLIQIVNKTTTKEIEKDQRKINNSSNNKVLQNISKTRNNIYLPNNNNYNIDIIKGSDTTLVNVNTTKTLRKKFTNAIINNNHNEINNLYSSLNLLPPVTIIKTTTSYNDIKHTYHKQQQHIDHIKLMKLVMDGLGLKKSPNMKTVNISQDEYVTKYREYLQRVHERKRRELREELGDHDVPLEIFSIVSSSLLPSPHSNRQKRNVLRQDDDNDDDRDDDEDNDDNEKERKQSLEERVKNILLLKKKYQKPRSTKKLRNERKTNIRLMFALKPEILNLSSSDIEEANIRLVLIHSPVLAIRNSKHKKTHTKPKNNSCNMDKANEREQQKRKIHQLNVVNIKLYFISQAGKRVWLDGRKVDINVDLARPDETHTQWLQFDVLKAVKNTIDNKRPQHIVLELQCDNCKRIGARILNDAFNTASDALADDSLTEGHHLMPVLNIIGHFNQSHSATRPHKYHDSHHSDSESDSPEEVKTTQRHYHHQTSNNKNRQNRRTNCYKANQRCCRHSMEVTFKEIKGFEFIIQPKVFDAGYCHGRCPPRYNPAHHHAMLQSLIWKQNHQKAPRPCCAPSKLVELEVLHVDEKDSEKLKISTWSDMKVVECACS